MSCSDNYYFLVMEDERGKPRLVQTEVDREVGRRIVLKPVDVPGGYVVTGLRTYVALDPARRERFLAAGTYTLTLEPCL